MAAQAEFITLTISITYDIILVRGIRRAYTLVVRKQSIVQWNASME